MSQLTSQRRKNRDNMQPAVPLLDYLIVSRCMSQEQAADLLDVWQDEFPLLQESAQFFLHRKGIPVYYGREFLQWGNMEEALEQEAADKKLKRSKLLELITLWVGSFVIVALLAVIMGLLEGYRLKEELQLKCSYNPQSLECENFLKTQYPQ